MSSVPALMEQGVFALEQDIPCTHRGLLLQGSPFPSHQVYLDAVYDRSEDVGVLGLLLLRAGGGGSVPTAQRWVSVWAQQHREL